LLVITIDMSNYKLLKPKEPEEGERSCRTCAKAYDRCPMGCFFYSDWQPVGEPQEVENV
jgi:hypothetical protein